MKYVGTMISLGQIMIASSNDKTDASVTLNVQADTRMTGLLTLT